jgi:hypothetical protein
MYEKLQVNKTIEVISVVSAFTAKREKGYAFAGESHDFWELLFLHSGRLTVTAGARVLRLYGGEVIFHKPFEFHKLAADNDDRPKYTVISFSASGANMHFFENCVLRPGPASAAVFSDLARLIAVGRGRSDGLLPDSFADGGRLEFFAKTLELFLLSCLAGQRTGEQVYSEDALLYSEAVDYMQRNIGGSPSVADIAAGLAVSESKLKRVFYKYSMLGVHRYFLNLKIERAGRLLSDGMPVGEVSRLLGFENQNYFSAVYKRETGINPSSVRRAE